MTTIDSVVAELRSKGSEKTRVTYERHGVPLARSLGVSVADLKIIAKKIKGQQALAMELYATGIFEAMYLAGIVADGAKMTREQLQAWAEGCDGLNMISDYTVPWVAVENAGGRGLAMQWIASDAEFLEAVGWRTYAGLVTTKPNEALDLVEIESLLKMVVKRIGGAKNRVKYTMNGFVITVGSYVLPLADQALATARQLGKVQVDMGDTACEVPLATAYIAKVADAGKQGVKRKTIRC